MSLVQPPAPGSYYYYLMIASRSALAQSLPTGVDLAVDSRFKSHNQTPCTHLNTLLTLLFNLPTYLASAC